MKSLSVYISIVLLGGLTVLALPASAQQTHTRNINLCAVDMSYKEMTGLIRSIRDFHDKANRDTTPEYVREVLTLQDGSMTLETRHDFALDVLKQGPEIATALWYRMSTRGTAPISEIDIHFTDYKRDVTISGAERDMVHGLLLLVSQKIEDRACSFGGSDTRRSFGYASSYFGGLFILDSTNSPIAVQIRDGRGMGASSFSIIICGIVCSCACIPLE